MSENKEFFLKNMMEVRSKIDNYTMALSTIFLLLSIYCAHTQYSSYIWLIVSCCWLFGLSIVSLLLSHQSCEMHCGYAYDYQNISERTGENDEDIYNKAMLWNRATKILNTISLSSFCIGILSFILYATLHQF
jgi:hypothetical protein